MKIAALLTLVLTLTVPLTGCGDSGPKKYPVSGKVTYQGKALPLGSVRFVPESGPPSLPAAIGGDGAFQLETVAGRQQVAVTAMSEPEGGRPDPNAEGGVDYSNATPARSLIPRKYGRADTSGVTVVVEAKENNEIEIDLK
ncbi:MAG: hypothetical protein U9N87_11440 [Planctomycetota bacterium]|nr:hypothetical protein [Planctomycetota bacterium]